MDSNFVSLSIFALKADGSEDGGTVTIVTASNRSASSQVWRISGWGLTIATDIDISTVERHNSGTVKSSQAVTAGWGSDDNLFISVAGTGDDDQAMTGFPTSYDDNQTDTASGGGGNLSGRVCTSSRNLASDSDDPGDYTITSSEAWVLYTLVIEPVAVSAAVQATVIRGDTVLRGDTIIN